MLDLLCDVGNWNASLANAMADEVSVCTQLRDKALHRLRTTVVALTESELDLIRRRYHPEKLAAQLREAGVSPRW
jgi:hypothetical protein